MNLKGKVAIVTGSGGKGSGRAEAIRLASYGCRVVVSDIDDAGGNETLRLIEANGATASFRRCDVSLSADVRALVEHAEQTFGGVDYLVNNASGPYRPGAPTEDWFETIRIDLFGALYGIQFSMEAMRRRGGGSILNIGSTSTLGYGSYQSGAPEYDLAKAGVIRLTTGLRDLRDTANIRVNCLVPDWVATPEVKEYHETLTPEQRKVRRAPDTLITLEEIAQLAADILVDPSLAGRVVVYWCGKEPALIPVEDPGYASLEPYHRPA